MYYIRASIMLAWMAVGRRLPGRTNERTDLVWCDFACGPHNNDKINMTLTWNRDRAAEEEENVWFSCVVGGEKWIDILINSRSSTHYDCFCFCCPSTFVPCTCSRYNLPWHLDGSQCTSCVYACEWDAEAGHHNRHPPPLLYAERDSSVWAWDCVPDLISFSRHSLTSSADLNHRGIYCCPHSRLAVPPLVPYACTANAVQ